MAAAGSDKSSRLSNSLPSGELCRLGFDPPPLGTGWVLRPCNRLLGVAAGPDADPPLPLTWPHIAGECVLEPGRGGGPMTLSPGASGLALDASGLPNTDGTGKSAEDGCDVTPQ